MSTTNAGAGTDPVFRDPLYGDLTLNWKWMLALGIFMAVLGVVGLGMAYGLTLINVIWIGALALIAGVAQIIEAFKCAGWKSVVGHVLLGLLYVAVGVVMIALPIPSAWWLTLLIGAALVVTGVLRIIMAFQMKGSAGFWLGLTGVISVVLGVLVYNLVALPTTDQLATPEGATAWFAQWGWVIGTFVAIELISHGAALVALALTARGRAGRSDLPSDTGRRATA